MQSEKGLCGLSALVAKDARVQETHNCHGSQMGPGRTTALLSHVSLFSPLEQKGNR